MAFGCKARSRIPADASRFSVLLTQLGPGRPCHHTDMKGLGCRNGLASAPRAAAAAAATANGWRQRLVPLTEMWESAASLLPLPSGDNAERLLPLPLPCRESADHPLRLQDGNLSERYVPEGTTAGAGHGSSCSSEGGA